MKSRRFQILLLLFLVSSLFGEDVTALSENSSLLTTADLDRAGIMRPNDLFEILDQWQAVTLDGYTYSASPWGSPMTRAESWSLTIDGIRIENQLLGFNSLNLLPITLNRIDTVEIFTAPRLISGELTQNGGFHFRTAPAPPNLSIRGSFHIGNETGDPGPFRYTEYSSINIDKIGPDLAAAVSYGGKTWEFLSDIGFQQYFPTDEKIIGRLRKVAPDSPKIKALTNSLTLRQKTGRWRNELQWFGVISENYLFFKPALRELRTRHSAVQLSWKLRHQLKDRGLFSLQVGLNENALAKQVNLPDINFDLYQRSIRIVADVIRQEPVFTNRYGIRLQRKQTRSPHLDGQLNTTWITLFESLSYPVTAALGQSVQLAANAGDGNLTGNALLTTKLHLGREHQLVSTLSFLGQLPGEHDDYAYFFEKGYALPEEYNWDYSLQSPLKSSRKLQGTVSWYYHPPRPYDLKITLEYGRFRNIYLETGTVHFDSTLFNLSGVTVGSGNGSYETFTAGIYLNYRLTPDLKTKLFTGYTGRIRGDQASRSLFSKIPSYKFSSKTEYENAGHFSLWLLIAWQSRTRWPDFEEVSSESSGFYQSEIPSQTNIDFAVQKSFWREKLVTSLIVSNVLNEDLYSHPVGSVQHLSLFIRIALKLS
ncbi:MAG: hypothetical protein GXO91_08755 [FCB group bacterium]|nr:hypothetical protein [FCB group bacterium]